MIDDPLALVLYAVTAMAGGMYPLGFLFGTCSACCEQGCRSDTCEGFDLEEAFSCRSPGFPLCFRSPDLLSLQFTSPCFGSGAAGTVQGTGADTPSSPGVTPGRGPLTGVTVTNGGSGYAILGRRAPVISLANSSAVPATITLALENVKDGCQVDTWRILSATVVDGGRGYGTGFGPATISAQWTVESGGVVVAAASGTVATKSVEPTITASVSGPGTGASFLVVLETVPQFPGLWRINSVSVSGSTSGYVDGSALVFNIGQASPYPGLQPASAVINVNQNGEITSVTVLQKGYYAITGVIDTITFASTPQRGSYYYPDPSLPAYVRPPNVTVIQGVGPYTLFGTDRGGGGSGAQITATVDGNPASPTFGQVTGLTLANAGTNYLAYYRDAIEYLGDGKFALGTIVPDPQPGNASAEATLDYNGVPTRGCWVSGEGIAFGTQVTELSNEILDMGVSEPPTGCCRYTYTHSSVVTGQVVFASTEQQCEDHFNNPSLPNIGTVISNKRDYSWGPECEDCNGNPITSRGFVVERTYSGRWIVTVDPPPEETPTGCVRFCGPSGLCGDFPREPTDENTTFGEDRRHNSLRRMCVRWLCRCYEGTGKKSQIDPETEEPLFSDPDDWYTVESTTEVGGPVVFGGTITEKLEAATSNLYGYEKFEHDYLFGVNEWQATEGDRFCLVYAFVFYGTSQKAIQDRCNFPDDEAPPGTVTPKDAYQIFPCDRCSCQ